MLEALQDTAEIRGAQTPIFQFNQPIKIKVPVEISAIKHFSIANWNVAAES